MNFRPQPKTVKNPSNDQREAEIETARRFGILHLWAGIVLSKGGITGTLHIRGRDEVIRVLSKFIDAHPARQNEPRSVRDARWNCNLALCAAVYQRALQFNGMQDFNHTIDRLEADLPYVPSDHELRYLFLHSLANALESRYDRQNQQPDNDRLIACLQELLALPPQGSEYTFWAAITLALALTQRAEHLQNDRALDEAGSWLTKAIELDPTDNRLGTVQTNIGRLLIQRYERSNNLEHLRTAISYLYQAVRLPANFFAEALLGSALGRLFKETKDIRDGNQAISRLRVALQSIPTQSIPGIDTILPQMQLDLSIVYLERYDVSQKLEDLDQAVTWMRKVTQYSQSPQYLRWQASSALGRTLIKRNAAFDNALDLDEAVSVLRHANKIGPGNVPAARFRSLENTIADSVEMLALALWSRSNKSRSSDDLDEALERQHEVIRSRPRLGTSNSLYLLVAILNDKLDRSKNPLDSEELIWWCQEAISRGQQGFEQRATILDIHAKALSYKHQATGKMEYLEQAIEKQQEALQLRPDNARLLINLERHLARKFHITAYPHILDKRIRLCRECIKLCPPDDTVLRSYALHALGDALAIRYKHLGIRLDFDESIAAHRQGLELRPPGNVNRWDSLLRLGLAYTEDSQPESKRLAIQSCQEALSCCPNDSPRTRSNILLHLANCTVTQEKVAIQEIDRSIELYNEANTLHPQDFPQPLILARMYGLRYDISQVPDDLGKVLQVLQESHDQMPPDYAFRPVILAMLAMPYLVDSSSSLPPPPRDPFEMIEEVATSDNALLKELHLHIATLWVQAARKRGHASLLKAYKFAMRNLEQWITSYPTAELQHSQTALRPQFASDACSAAIEAGDISQAVELLEQGRGLLWARLTRYRQPLDALRELDGRLAEEFESVARELEQLSVSTYSNLSSSDLSSMMGVLSNLGLLPSTPGSAHMPTLSSSFIPGLGRQREMRLSEDLMGFDNRMRLLHDATSRWNNVVERIRRIRGWSNFLLPSPFADLQKAAAAGPVVIVNVSAYRCDAIIIRDVHLPLLVPLPDASPQQFQDLSLKLEENLENLHSADHEDKRTIDHYRAQIKAVLRSLWTLVVQRVVQRLEELGCDHGSRIWWYPTGALCRLPLHAAGPYKRGQKNAHDLYVCSYVTTLSSTLRVGQGDWTPDATAPGLLVIGVPGDDPTQDSYLPNVEQEICTIIDAIPSHLLSLQHVLVGEYATLDSVRSELPNYHWAHFTCHGYQNPEPLNSFFQLYGQSEIKLIELISSRLPKAQLAFLSACNTATGDFEKTPDEVLHLAAVMQFCGFRSVIGTLWPMCDEDGPSVAREFYQYMYRNKEGGRTDSRDSAEALHRAVDELRSRKVPIERWINFVHFGH
ncbi:hypothetical protein EIP86_000419 [Pleurotus ostreatoroseus]|nr:hypothetical protein EIP86_000419 [Pleurotus ostreatoroseus]